MKATVDVVITSYEEDISKINRTLASCCDQSKQFDHIFLVDDGSVIQPLQTDSVFKNSRIEIILLPNNVGISKARNIAINRSHADYLACVNIEIAPHHEWTQRCVDVLEQNPNVGAVFGKMVPYKDSLYSKWRLRFHELKYDRPSGFTTFAAGHAVLFRKKALDEVNGYNESLKLVMEDSDICLRMKQKGYDTYFLNQTSVTSYQDDNLLNLANKHVVRCTSGTMNNMTLYKFFIVSSRDTMVRITRNVLKGRWYFLYIDVAVYLLMFHFFIERKKRSSL